MKTLSVLFLLCFPASEANAQTVSLTPSVVELKGSYRQSTTQTLTMTNTTGLALSFDLQAQDVVVANGKRLHLPAGDVPHSIAATAVCLERACMLADATILSERDLAMALPSASSEPLPEATGFLKADLDLMEREHIVRVLQQLRGSKVAAARRLGISRRTLYRRLEFHKLPLS